MKRDFLEGLGLEKEKIDKILNENGKDLENTKKELTAQRDDYKNQLDNAQKTLKSFEGINVEELQGKISDLEKEIGTEKTNAEKRIADLKFDHLIENKAIECGAKNTKAVIALLDIDTLKESKNQEADIDAAFEAIKKDNDYLFNSKEPFENPSGVGETKAGSDGDSGYTNAMRIAMGLPVDE